MAATPPATVAAFTAIPDHGPPFTQSRLPIHSPLPNHPNPRSPTPGSPVDAAQEQPLSSCGRQTGAMTDGRLEVRNPARDPRPDGAADARGNGRAARLRHRAPHRADQRRRAAAESGDDLRVAPPPAAAPLDYRVVGYLREQPQGEVLL